MASEPDPDDVLRSVVGKYAEYMNPHLARLMSFAGFGVEVRAEGCYVYDQAGRKLLDCLGGYGVFSLGHRHPKVVEAVRAQLDLMPLSAKTFFSAPAADLAERLAELTPEGLRHSFFTNSGTEAVEGALKFAKGATGRAKLVAFEGAYHGKTLGALSVTGREKYRRPFEPLLPGATFVPFGDAAAAAAAIDDGTAAVIVEPIQGEGGIRVPPAGFLAALRSACDRHGALLIADEVQTGLGRAGYMFACERDGVSPDLLTTAKCLGGGVMPIGAITGTRAVFDAVFAENPIAHTSTFGGNGLACAAALAALEVIESEGLVERSRLRGARLKSGLQEVADRHADLIGEVRGLGLMLGVEFRADEVGELVVAQLVKRGVFVAYALNNPRVLRFEPPLIIEEAQIDFALAAFEGAVAETAGLLASLA